MILVKTMLILLLVQSYKNCFFWSEITQLTFYVSLTSQDHIGPLLQVLPHCLASKSLFWCNLPTFFEYLLDFHLIILFSLIFNFFFLWFSFSFLSTNTWFLVIVGFYFFPWKLLTFLFCSLNFLLQLQLFTIYLNKILVHCL